MMYIACLRHYNHTLNNGSNILPSMFPRFPIYRNQPSLLYNLEIQP